MLMANLLLSVLFLKGALAQCPDISHLFFKTPEKMEALSGSCLQIPCNFSTKAYHNFDQEEVFGVWIKNHRYFEHGSENVIYNSSRTINPYPMNITGNLKQKECTTLFSNINLTHEDVYYFRIESTSFKATAICNSLQITVRDSPPTPSMIIPGDLKENQSVTVTCSALTPCPRWPPKLTWNLQKDSHNHTEQNKDGSFTTKIQESITLSEQHDGYNISCSASYPVNEGEEEKTAEETKTLSVSYAPKNISVSISPSGLVSAGTKVNLTCSCSRAKPPVSSFTWFKISNNSQSMVSDGEFYSFNATERGTYYCQASNELGHNRSSEVHINIKEAAGGSLSEALLGGIIGGILFLFLIIGIILALVFWSRSKSDDSSQQNLYQTAKELAAVESKKSTEEEEGIHYGEINFSKQRPHHEQEGGQQQETLYAQVRGAGSRQVNDSPEDLYAQVKKK
ncbi:B-cell receptor CD22-like [Halichoeres trimaculatus]|uniref:B-cell receptor CD22-like n=1 Tax=Halichoeres trimaculatus TaxID=147232 RepID=UPI003D9DF9C7